ncbi:MAG: hypothetical protein ACRDM1_08140 [Gaiellaceae bacterium]
MIARELGALGTEVTLRLPPPLDEPLRLDRDGRVWDDHALVAEARPGDVGLAPPDPVAFGDALAAEAPDLGSPFPNCFVCGYARGSDGLHIHAGPVAGLDVHAATWTVARDTVGPEFVWAALDCPGAYATGALGRGAVVLGRLTARVERVPEPGQRCIVVAWHLGSERRKHGAGTALFTDGGELLGIARALWVEPRG